MVAMVMFVQTYALGMPILYFAGFLCFFTTYWQNKSLFLRFYKNPPLYTKQLVKNVIYIMEWGLLLHLSFGAFMITNQNVFDYEVNPKADQPFKHYGRLVGNIASNFMHIEINRFDKPHGAMYIFVSGVILFCFLLDKFTSWCLDIEAGLFSYSIVCFCDFCRNKIRRRTQNVNNLLSEIPISGDWGLIKEYADCKSSRVLSRARGVNVEGKFEEKLSVD